VDADHPFTRIHEFKHLHPERPSRPGTIIMREYSRAARRTDDPYYPIGTTADRAILERYHEAARRIDRLIVGGRLAKYQYLNMDQVIGAALKCFDEEVVPALVKMRSDRQDVPK
jgi:UDP-galactopyranose mutase